MGMLNAIQLLALFIGGIVVANTMIMSIFERTREIGTLRAVGWRRRRILGQVLLESLFSVHGVGGLWLSVGRGRRHGDCTGALRQSIHLGDLECWNFRLGLRDSGGAGRAGRAISSLARRPT
jgi:hypothetical protein